MSGSNQKHMVDSAMGHEQDLSAGYSRGFVKDLITLEASLTYAFYPFASKKVTGSNNPSYLMPLAGIAFATPVEISFQLSYFAGVTDATTSLSYLYINPTLNKTLPLGNIVAMNLGFGFGYKVYSDSDIRDVNDNAIDLLFDAGLNIAIPGGLYIAPALHASWTNLDKITIYDDPSTPADESDTRNATSGDEYMIYGSINIGANF